MGNLLLTGLVEMHGGDTVRALDELAGLLGACGRVLPMADVPLDLVARVERVDREDPAQVRTIRGQVAIATTPGRVRSIRLAPADPPVNPAVLEAIAGADVVSLGPGSWYTSVLPHLLVPAAPRGAGGRGGEGGGGPEPRAAARGDGRFLAGGACDRVAGPPGRSGIAQRDRGCGLGG